VNPRHPDFTDKRTNKGLWIKNSNTPEWVHRTEFNVDQETIESQRQPMLRQVQQARSNEALWRELVDESGNWQDFRALKEDGAVNPRHPDFTDKRTNKGLWIKNSNTPEWVHRHFDIEQAATKQASAPSMMQVEEAEPAAAQDEEMPAQLEQAEAQGGDAEAAAESAAEPAGSSGGVDAPLPRARGLFLTSHSKGEAMRKRLRELKAPIYGTKEQLWARLEKAEEQNTAAGLQAWKSLQMEPENWIDHRHSKLTQKVDAQQPDFEHISGSAALWLSDPLMPNEMRRKYCNKNMIAVEEGQSSTSEVLSDDGLTLALWHVISSPTMSESEKNATLDDIISQNGKNVAMVDEGIAEMSQSSTSEVLSDVEMTLALFDVISSPTMSENEKNAIIDDIISGPFEGEEYSDEGVLEYSDEEYSDEGVLGFSPSEVQLLLEQGIKPWDDEAKAAIAVLR